MSDELIAILVLSIIDTLIRLQAGDTAPPSSVVWPDADAVPPARAGTIADLVKQMAEQRALSGNN